MSEMEILNECIELYSKLKMDKPNCRCAALDALEFMRSKGQSITLNWGEDNDLWECSWITSGARYTGFSKEKQTAIRNCLKKAIDLAG